MTHIQDRYRSQSVEQAVAHLIEELAEATQAAAKSLRFGLTSGNPELPEAEQETNLVWLRREMIDVVGAYRALSDLLVDEDIVDEDILDPGELIGDLRGVP